MQYSDEECYAAAYYFANVDRTRKRTKVSFIICNDDDRKEKIDLTVIQGKGCSMNGVLLLHKSTIPCSRLCFLLSVYKLNSGFNTKEGR